MEHVAEVVITTSQPMTLPPGRAFVDPANPEIYFGVGWEGRWADSEHFMARPTVWPRVPPGTYRGTATFRPCYETLFGGYCPVLPGYGAPWSGSVDYEITVTELTTKIETTVNTTVPGIPFGRLRNTVALVRPELIRPQIAYYNVAVTAGLPYINVRATNEGFGWTVWADILPGTPPGLVTGTLLVNVCRDDPLICASPHKGSPFSVPISTNVVATMP